MSRVMLVSLLLLAGCVPAGAEEISLITPIKESKQANVKLQKSQVLPQAAIKKETPKSNEHIDRDFQQMKDFMSEENERLKTLKILNLDLERAGLELKQKEIQVKMIKLNKEGGVLDSNAVVSVKSSKPMVKITSIFLNDEGKEAVINVDGLNLNAHEGEQIASGIAIKKITPETVTVQYADGQIQELKFGDS